MKKEERDRERLVEKLEDCELDGVVKDEKAKEIFRRAVDFGKEVGDHRIVSRALFGLAVRSSDYDTKRDYFKKAVEYSERGDDSYHAEITRSRIRQLDEKYDSKWYNVLFLGRAKSEAA
ncbi:MAG: hypothetical protein KJ592_05050 [Nanoarchaeota archaeon]|nr:hypothetical protein [Nanoarchaeota archaeon]